MEEPYSIPHYVQLVVYTLIIVIIVGVNITVILWMFFQGKINVTKVFLIAISISNILTGSMIITLEIYVILASTSVTFITCHCILYFENVCFMANMYTIVVFIIDVHQTILVNYRRTYSTARVVTAVVLVWTGSLTFSTKSLIVAVEMAKTAHKEESELKELLNISNVGANMSFYREDNNKEMDSDKAVCSYLMEDSQGDVLNRYVDLFVNLFIPQAVCTVCLFKLGVKLWRREQEVNNTLKQGRKLVKLLCGLLVLNVSCWLPVTVSDIILDTTLLHMKPEAANELESSRLLQAVKFFFAVLALCSMSVNAVIMLCLNDRMSSLLQLLKSCCSKSNRNIVEPIISRATNNNNMPMTNFELNVSATAASNNQEASIRILSNTLQLVI